ncbi:MAG: geranylgeranylglycerol-phosphate geranylgeranyltransferase [Methanoregulaceae archaeon]
MRLPGLIRILRPVNAFVAGLASVLAYFIASGTLVPETLLLIAIVFLITAGGNTINDYYDAGIDRINRPDRPIPSGEVSLRGAGSLSFILFTGGIVLSLFTNPLCITIAVFNAALLFLYACRFKKTLFIGNMTVAYLSASIFLFGGALYGPAGMAQVSAIALITFFAMLSRELLKAAEDVEGDARAGAVTVPVEYGVRVTVLLSLLFVLCAITGSLYPVRWWGLPYFGGILIVDTIILVAALRPLRCRKPSCIRDTGATTLLKLGMFASLVVFTIAATLR